MNDIIERLRSKSPYLHGSSAERTMEEAADGNRAAAGGAARNSRPGTPFDCALNGPPRLGAKDMKWQTIKVRDYGDDWLNRLATILKMTEKMDDREREATLTFVVGKYQRRALEHKS